MILLSKKLKKDFPIFGHYGSLSFVESSVASAKLEACESEVGTYPLVYLDNAATTHKPQAMLDAVNNFYTRCNANIYRGVHGLSEQATLLYEASRDVVQKFVGAAHREEIIFTSGTTEGVNFIANAWGLAHVGKGDEILITQAEHHANLLPWIDLAHKTGATLKYIPLDKTTYQIAENPQQYITSRTKLVAVTHCSNLLGDIWQIGQLEAVIELAHAVGARVLLDAAQSVAHRSVDVQDLDVDFMVFSGHKLFAPTGVGVLFIKKALHDEVAPYRLGGAMVYSTSYEESTWQQAPQKFEAGTPPIAQVIGLGAVIEYINKSFTFDELIAYESSLCRYLLQKLDEIDGIIIAGNRDMMDRHGHLVAFAVQGVHAHDLAGYLSMKNIAVRAGHHCAQPLSNLLGLDSTVRVSFSIYNSIEDIDVFIHELAIAITSLKGA